MELISVESRDRRAAINEFNPGWRVGGGGQGEGNARYERETLKFPLQAAAAAAAILRRFCGCIADAFLLAKIFPSDPRGKQLCAVMCALRTVLR